MNRLDRRARSSLVTGSAKPAARACCAAACLAVNVAATATPSAEELLGRLIDKPVPGAAWARAKPRQNIPTKPDIAAGMAGTVALQRGGNSVRYMVYLSAAAAQQDFARQAYPPKDQSAGPMREVGPGDRPGPAMVCGEALLATRPAQRVQTCTARHASLPLIVRIIVPPTAAARVGTPAQTISALRHADALAITPERPATDQAARLYRALRNQPIPRIESVADLLQGLPVLEDEVRAPNRADGVIGRLTLQGRGTTVRYVVFGAQGRIEAWVDRAAALNFDGHQAAGPKDELKESSSPRRLRAPVRSQLWANRRGDALCDVVAQHNSLPLALRVSMPIKASVRAVPNERGRFEFRPDLFDQFLCFQLAVDLADWAAKRGTQ